MYQRVHVLKSIDLDAHCTYQFADILIRTQINELLLHATIYVSTINQKAKTRLWKFIYTKHQDIYSFLRFREAS